jgi:hypothetical protein
MMVAGVLTGARRLATNGWCCAVALVLTAAVSLWSLVRVPDASPVPILLGLVPFAAGKYVLCPLRWHALSVGGQRRWWHLRAYAESELLGLLSPVHAGADLWRVHRLRGVGLNRTAAFAEVTLDRLVGAAGIALGVLLIGIALPWPVLVAILAIGSVVLATGVVVRIHRPDLFARRPLPSPRVFVQGLLLSIGYQATIAALVYGAVTAVGETVHPINLLTVFAASQLASMIPGVSGANPRAGALAAGLASIGTSWTAALGAVALITVLPWVPALLLGGVSLAVHRWSRSRSAGCQDLAEQPEVAADHARHAEPACVLEVGRGVDRPGQHVLGALT